MHLAPQTPALCGAVQRVDAARYGNNDWNSQKTILKRHCVHSLGKRTVFYRCCFLISSLCRARRASAGSYIAAWNTTLAVRGRRRGAATRPSAPSAPRLLLVVSIRTSSVVRGLCRHPTSPLALPSAGCAAASALERGAGDARQPAAGAHDAWRPRGAQLRLPHPLHEHAGQRGAPGCHTSIGGEQGLLLCS